MSAALRSIASGGVGGAGFPGGALLCVVAAGESGEAPDADGLDGATPFATVVVAAAEVPTSSVSISFVWK